jgi:hypothetical protein
VASPNPTLVDPIAIAWIRIICDAPGCGYESVEQNVSAAFIGRPCPNCGANLLTEEDYAAALRLFALTAAINAGIGPLAYSGEVPTVSVNPRGDDDPADLILACIPEPAP